MSARPHGRSQCAEAPTPQRIIRARLCMVSREGLRELVTKASQVPSRSLLRPAGVACSVAICGGGRSSRPTSWNGNVLRGMPMWREGEREAHFSHSETETGREGGRGRNTMKTDRRNGSGKFFDDRAGSQGRDATYVRAAGKARLASKGSRRAQM